MKRIENLTAEKLVSVLDLFGTGEGEKEEKFIEETKGITFTIYEDGSVYGSDGKDYFYNVEISDSEWEQLEEAAVLKMEIFNGTPHPINIVANSEFYPEIRKYVVPEEQKPEIVASIPSYGMLSAKINTISGDPVGGIPVFEKTVSGCDELPEGYDIYIVSQLYVSAARACGIDMSKLYTVADPVYSQDGRTILGSRGICPTFEDTPRWICPFCGYANHYDVGNCLKICSGCGAT